MCPVGFDFGTMFLVAARKDEEGKTKAIAERNCFLKVGIEFEDMVKSSDFKYIKDEENGQECLYIVGTDSLRLSNLLQTTSNSGERKSALRRPMADMIINSKSEKKAIQILKYISQAIIGPPQEEGEVAVISIPADPLSGEFNNVFHRKVCSSFIKELGYNVFDINEALAVAFSSNPTTEDEDGNKLNMTGLSVSFGAGGTNSCLCYKSIDTIRFSIPKGGDWLDQQVSNITSLTVSEVTAQKEKLSIEGKLDLSNIDYSNEVLGGLYIYYKNLIEIVVNGFKEEFIKKGTTFPCPIEVVVSGGTSKPSGFEAMVEQTIKEVGWPFEIKCVRRAKDPLTATAVGCLNAAISREKKAAQ